MPLTVKVLCLQCNQSNSFLYYIFRMKSLHVLIVLSIIFVVCDVSVKAKTCQESKNDCITASQDCLKTCTVVTVCEGCVAAGRACAYMCDTKQNNSGSKQSKKGNIKKLKRTIKKLLRLV